MAQNEYEILAESVEYLPVEVLATRNGNPFNPTTSPVAIALPAFGTDPSVYNVATWQTSADGEYFAQLLIGTGGVVLAEGKYDIYVRITATPEQPVIYAGVLRIV